MQLVESQGNSKLVRIGTPQMGLISFAVQSTLDSGIYLEPYVAAGLKQLVGQIEKLYSPDDTKWVIK
jgi:hypothetical protein